MKWADNLISIDSSWLTSGATIVDNTIKITGTGKAHKTITGFEASARYRIVVAFNTSVLIDVTKPHLFVELIVLASSGVAQAYSIPLHQDNAEGHNYTCETIIAADTSSVTSITAVLRSQHKDAPVVFRDVQLYPAIEGITSEEVQSKIETAIDKATNAITGNDGGHVRLYPADGPREIVIMDSPTVHDALRVWRWNLNGLGYSRKGYDGPYETAMTMDGAIVADFITSGTLDGERIRAGSIKTELLSVETRKVIEDKYTKSETESRIEAKAGEVAIEVSKTEINNMQIGGVNLYDKDKTVSGYLTTNIDKTDTGFTFYGVVSNDGNLRVHNVIDSNGWYTVSFEMKVAHTPFDINIEINDVLLERIGLTTEWQRFELTHYVENYTGDVYHFVDFEKISSQIHEVRKFKVERGQKATDYSPSFTDIENSIAKIDVKANEINLSVDTIKTNGIGGNNLIKNGDFKNGLDSWATGEWAEQGNTVGVWTDSEWCLSGKNSASLNTHGLPPEGARSDLALYQAFATVPNQWYTISLYSAGHRALHRFQVQKNVSDGVYVCEDIDGSFGGNDLDNWNHITLTFKAETTQSTLWCGLIHTYGTNGYLWVTDVCCVEGKIASKFTPNIDEYSTTTQMQSAIDVKADEINLSVNKLKRGGRMARWVRCYMWGNSVNNGNHTVEIEVWSNGVNVARGKSAYSSHNAVHQNSALTDGSKDTGWYTYLDDHYDGMDFYWEIDLGQEYSIDDIWLWNYYGDGRKYNFSLNTIDENLNSINVYNTNIGGTYVETAQGKQFILNLSLYNNQLAKIDIKSDQIKSTVESVQTDLQDNYPTTTTMNSAITQKANEITSTVEETKRVGVELLPQGYLHNSPNGYHAVQETFYWNQWGLYTARRAWVRSIAIAIDRNLPLSYYFYVQNTGGISTQMHIGFEQLDWRGNEIGENASTLYVTSDIFTGYRVFEGVVNSENFHSDTKFIRLRWLSNWNSGSIAEQYMHEMSVKQLRVVSSSTQIAQMSDRLESKVDVNGVKSTIIQSAGEVQMAFNNISNWDGSSGTEARILFNHWGIHTQASDGSYSKLGGGKVEHYIAGANYKYHSLIHIETIKLYNEWGIIDGYFGVPYRYQGLNFNVIATISYVGFDRNVAHAFKNLNISVSEINPSNCTYRLVVAPIGVDVLGAYTVNASQVEVVVTIIA